MAVAVASYFCGPASGGAAAVNSWLQPLQRRRSISYRVADGGSGKGDHSGSEKGTSAVVTLWPIAGVAGPGMDVLPFSRSGLSVLWLFQRGRICP